MTQAIWSLTVGVLGYMLTTPKGYVHMLCLESRKYVCAGVKKNYIILQLNFN